MKNRNMIFGAIMAVLACFGFLPQMLGQAQGNDVFTTSNTPEGFRALGLQTSNTFNTGVGWESLALQTTATAVTGCGAGTLVLNTADNNSAFGAAALEFNTMGTENIALGGFALLHNNTGSQNTAVGFSAMQNATGGSVVFNTAVGISALENTTANANVAVGDFALQSDTGGNFNTAIGAVAGSAVTTGSGNVYIGQGMSGLAGDMNQTYIKNIYGTLQPQVGMNPDFVTVNSAGRLGRSGLSSRRYKHDIKPMDKASEAIFQLKPVSFRYNKELDATQTIAFGLIAEEVAEVYPDLVGRNPKGQVESVRYEQINAMLLNEFIKEHKKVGEQQTRIADLNSRVAKQEATIAQQQKGMEVLTAQLKEQAAQIQKVSAQLEVNNPAPQVVVNKP